MTAIGSGPALEAKSVSITFGGLRAVAEVSFTVPNGSLTALIGPNGAGKTTFFNLVTNLFPPDSGEIMFYGTSLRGRSPAEIAGMGLLRTFQTARVFPGMTALENVLVGAYKETTAGPLSQMLWLPAALREERRLTERATALLDLVGLSVYRDVAATSLPIGAQKLVEVCRAVMARPRLLLLDEPAAGLSPAERGVMANVIRGLPPTLALILIEHDIDLALGLVERVVVMSQGAVLVEGKPDEIRRNAQVQEIYLGKPRRA
jgi:branched-chain amino acid transport system ATP-binding protein